MLFHDRHSAGQMLASRLERFKGRPDALVLALPRGGVPVGFEVARRLNLPLNVFVVRKLGVPGQEELAMGALASGGVRVLNPDVVQHLRIPADWIDRITAREQIELERREQLYRNGRPGPQVQGRTAILVDDGLATGSSMRSAARALKEQGAAKVVVAVPVASAQTCAQLRSEVDEVVCPATPEPFYAVGQWYNDFSQTTDDEVRRLLALAAEESGRAA